MVEHITEAMRRAAGLPACHAPVTSAALFCMSMTSIAVATSLGIHMTTFALGSQSPHFAGCGKRFVQPPVWHLHIALGGNQYIVSSARRASSTAAASALDRFPYLDALWKAWSGTVIVFEQRAVDGLERPASCQSCILTLLGNSGLGPWPVTFTTSALSSWWSTTATMTGRSFVTSG